MTDTCHNWNDLSSIIDVATLDPTDEQCLAELQEVIERHGLEKKFGVARLHKHFDIADDEMLVESNSPKTRQLLTQPYSTADVDPSQLITTTWRFDNHVRYGCTFCNKDHCELDAKAQSTS